MTTCQALAQDRRRSFWTTQMCGATQNACGGDCGEYGMAMAPVEGGSERERRIDNAGWVQSLIYNILLTDGRMSDSACGYRPGARGGHWSDSFRSDGLTAGSLLRTLGTFGRINDQVNLAGAYAKADMAKLVTMKVADSVDVKATYGGGLSINLDITVYGRSGDVTRVGLTGSPTGSEWRWVGL